MNRQLMIEKKGDKVIFNGEFDKAGHAEVREELDKIVLDFSGKDLVFDFTDLKFMNSEGIGYLMEVHTHLSKNDKRLSIVGVNEHLDDVFETVGLKEIIHIKTKS